MVMSTNVEIGRGYRRLEPGEVIKAEDQFWSWISLKPKVYGWMKVWPDHVGQRVNAGKDTVPFRRRRR